VIIILFVRSLCTPKCVAVGTCYILWFYSNRFLIFAVNSLEILYKKIIKSIRLFLVTEHLKRSLIFLFVFLKFFIGTLQTFPYKSIIYVRYIVVWFQRDLSCFILLLLLLKNIYIYLPEWAVYEDGSAFFLFGIIHR